MFSSKVSNKPITDLYTWIKNCREQDRLINPMPEMPENYLSLIRNLLNFKFNMTLSLKEVYELLYKEGVLPAKAYKIPSWYVLKYGS